MANLAKINDWLQLLGTFGVIASLVFVGLQMKQAQDIALSQAYQGRSAITVESYAAAINSPTMLSALEKMYAGKDSELTSREAIALEYQTAMEMAMYENNHYQYQSGFLSEEHWQRNLTEMTCTFSAPLRRQMLANWTYRESFAAVLDEAIAQAIARANPCWDDFQWPYPTEATPR